MTLFDQIALVIVLGWWPAGFVLCLLYNWLSPCPMSFLDQGDFMVKIGLWPVTLLCGAAITYSHLRRNRRVQD